MHLRPAIVVALLTVGGLVFAQEEFARVLRDGDQATLSVFDPRPVDAAARKLVEDFGVAINVEDPVYLYRDDVQDLGVTRTGIRRLIPRAALLEMRIGVRPDGSLLDVRQVVSDLAEAANAQLPFQYRIDTDGDAFFLVPTQTRDEQGRTVGLEPILDRTVTIPPGTRTIIEHITLVTQALERQTGLTIACCQAGVAGVPWGSTVVSFEARDEPARRALLRLLRSEPGRDRLVRSGEGGSYRLIKSTPGREHWYWMMRCQPATGWCFINVAAIPEKS